MFDWLFKRSPKPTRRITMYSRQNCCLCDKALAVIEKVGRDTPLEIEIIDIDKETQYLEAYTTKIPVIAIDGVVHFELKVAELWLRRALRGEAPKLRL